MRVHSQPQPDPLSPEQLSVLEDLGYLLDETEDLEGGCWQALDPAGQPVRLRLLELPTGTQRARRLRHLSELRRLRHPGLARLEALHELPGGVLAAACQFVEGTDLAVVLGARGRLRRDEAAQLLADLGQALAHLHEQGLVHGDVSAANTVITPEGHAVLIDLLGGAGELGTPGVAAPERLQGEEPSAAADVYALAALVEQAVAASQTAAGGLALLADALSEDPGARPTARELAERAQRLAAPVPVSLPQSAGLAAGMLRACAQVPTRRAPRPWWRRRGGGRDRRLRRSRERRFLGWGSGSEGRGGVRLAAAGRADLEALVRKEPAGVASAESEGLARRRPGSLRQAVRPRQAGRHSRRQGRAGGWQDSAQAGAGLSGAARRRRRGWPWAGAPVELGLLLVLIAVLVPLLTPAWSPAARLWATGDGGGGGVQAAGGTSPAAATATTGAASGATAGPEPGAARPPTPSAAGAGAPASAGPADDDLLGAVVSLARSRDAALEAGDAQALASTTVPGSGAASADQRLLESLQGSGQTVTGLRTDLQGVVEVPVAGLPLSEPVPAGARAVRATLSQASHQRHADAGDWTVPVQRPRQVVLVLVPEPWRVLEVLEVEDEI